MTVACFHYVGPSQTAFVSWNSLEALIHACPRLQILVVRSTPELRSIGLVPQIKLKTTLKIVVLDVRNHLGQERVEKRPIAIVTRPRNGALHAVGAPEVMNEQLKAGTVTPCSLVIGREGLQAALEKLVR